MIFSKNGINVNAVSDLHIDFWINPSKGSQEKKIERFLRERVGVGGDILVVAGDIGHYTHQNLLFLQIASGFFDAVFYVFGNHDFYLTPGDRKRGLGSMEKWSLFKKETSLIDKVHVLEGDVVDIGALRIGGAGGWYDGSHLTNVGYSMEYLLSFWRRTMNDYGNIDFFEKDYGGDFLPFFQKEKKKIEAVAERGADIIVTHVPPYPVSSLYSFGDADAFYFFNGREFFDRIPVWICGHTHSPRRKRFFVSRHTEIVIDPLGYPG